MGGLKEKNGLLVHPLFKISKNKFLEEEIKVIIKSYNKLITIHGGQKKRILKRSEYPVDFFSLTNHIPEKYHSQYDFQESDYVVAINLLNDLTYFKLHLLNLSTFLILEGISSDSLR